MVVCISLETGGAAPPLPKSGRGNEPIGNRRHLAFPLTVVDPRDETNRCGDRSWCCRTRTANRESHRFINGVDRGPFGAGIGVALDSARCSAPRNPSHSASKCRDKNRVRLRFERRFTLRNNFRFCRRSMSARLWCAHCGYRLSSNRRAPKAVRSYSRPAVSHAVIIDDDVFIGARSVVLKGVRIGARSVIGAGSVVTESIPADAVAVGVPARVVKHL